METLITSLLTVAVLFSPATVVTRNQPSQELPKVLSLQLTEVKQSIIAKPKEEISAPEKPKKAKPVVYTVVAGDSLTKIGTAHNVEWQRLWAKNKQLKHPDNISVGDEIAIPLPSEKLKREIPAVVALPAITPGVVAQRVAVANFDASNTYDYGFCTWYVKNKRGASLPNMLGNANAWYSSARSAGMSVGSTPQAGAVGTTTAGAYGHVVYVESVNSDGTVNISEMNYSGWGVESRRTASASEFLYIY